MARTWKSGRRRRQTALISIGMCAAVCVFVLYRYMAFNLWLYSDARNLKPYPHELIRNGEVVAQDTDLSEGERAIEKAIVQSNTGQRLVVHLSRSDIRYGFLHRRAFVKVFLETSLPGEPDRVQRIKFLNVLERENGTWSVGPEGAVQLTVP